MATLVTPDNCSPITRSTAFGVSAARIAHAQWSFAVDGGAISTIIPGNNFLLPVGAIITGVSLQSTTACVGASGTLAVGLNGGPTSTVSLVGATAVASWGTAAFVQGIPVPQTTSSWLKITSPSTASVTIATTPFSAGVIEIYVFYFESST